MRDYWQSGEVSTSPARNIALVQDLYAAREREDMAAMLAYMTDDVDWGVEAESSSEVPWHGTGKGKQFVAHWFAMLDKHCVFTRFESSDFLASDTGVAVLVTFEMTLKKNGHEAVFNIVHHFTIRDGKISKWRGTEDTAHTKALWNT